MLNDATGTGAAKPCPVNANPPRAGLDLVGGDDGHGRGIGLPASAPRALQSEGAPLTKGQAGAIGMRTAGSTCASTGAEADADPYSLIHATKLGKTIRWTVKFAQRSPRILPRWARMLPLRVVALYLELTMKGNHVHRPRWGDTRPSRP